MTTQAPRQGEPPAGARTFGMTLFLTALGVLFAASLVAYLVIRTRAEVWPPAGNPGMPAGLWVSTGILLLCSVALHRAVRAARLGRQGVLRGAMLVSVALAAAFLVSQTLNWLQLSAAGLTARSNLYAFTFYMLTGLHAAHVIGGLVPLFIVTRRAVRGVYGPERDAGVRYCAMYWHFLDVVWVVMFLLLVIAA